MTALGRLCAAVVAAGAITLGGLAGWPGWSIAPVVAAVAGCAGVAWWIGRSGRYRPRALTAAVLVAVLMAAAVFVVAVSSPREQELTAGPDQAVIDGATATLRMFYTVTADASDTAVAARRAELESRLTGRLRDDYVTYGDDVALPAAAALGASQTITVQRVGVDRRSGDRMRLLMFAELRVRVPAARPPETTVPIARSVVLRRVGPTWRVADIYPVGIGG